MPFDSEGIFTRKHNWEDDRINGLEIVTDHHDEEDDNFAEAFNETFLRDGRVAMQNTLNMGGFKIQNCSSGVSDTDVVIKAQLTQSKSDLTDLINSFWTIGDIKTSVQSTNHSGWLLCNGQAVSRTVYAELFALIGTKFGAGNGTTTFNVPDYRGKFLRGLGGHSALDIYTTQPEGLPNIQGSFLNNGNSPTDAAWGAFSYSKDGKGSNTGSANDGGTYTFNASKSNAIYGASNHVTPINQAVYFFIKAKNI
ncbi:MAG: tail fiber protein [Alphaproteobacteria bacterium]|nr:tail fiber protein [Alphaproteobacteria bacterium]